MIQAWGEESGVSYLKSDDRQLAQTIISYFTASPPPIDSETEPPTDTKNGTQRETTDRHPSGTYATDTEHKDTTVCPEIPDTNHPGTAEGGGDEVNYILYIRSIDGERPYIYYCTPEQWNEILGFYLQTISN